MESTTRRRTLLALAAAAGVLITLGAPASAGAAVNSCSFNGEGRYVCSAPVSEYPTASAWGRIYDYLEPIGCSGVQPGGFVCTPRGTDPVAPSAWRWSDGGWRAVARGELASGTVFWFTPYSGSWWWAWNRTSGWVAIQDRFAHFRWYATAPAGLP